MLGRVVRAIKGEAQDTEHGESLNEAVKHDYTTTDHGIVPLDKRKPFWHLTAIIFTLEAGFVYIFLGFTLNEAGFTLPATTAILAVGAGFYIIYGAFAASLGNRTGQTHSLLSRSIFGVTGSVIVSVMIIFTQTGWTGFQANLTAQLFNGLYGWGAVLAIGVILAFVMVANNLFGFTGISVFARYIVAPLMLLWVTYLVIKGLTTEPSRVLDAHPHVVSALAWPAAVTSVIGLAMWGTEPDFWRFSRPKFWPPVGVYVFAMVFGIMINGVAGWITGQIAGTADFGPAIKVITNFSLFGATWLAFLLVVLGQWSVNDGNYYEVINAAQNLVGGWKRWKRVYTCLIAASLASLAAWIVPYVFTNGFEKIASFGAIGTPTATMIMATDHFLLPRLFKISRPMTRVPTWSQTPIANWPALVALVIAVLFGAWGSGIFPGEDPTTVWGIAPVEAWLLGSVVYVALVAIVRVAVPNVTAVLGFSAPALEVVGDGVGGSEPIDVASEGELAQRGVSAAPAPEPVAS
jgi:purine-cytosine permease-like protein